MVQGTSVCNGHVNSACIVFLYGHLLDWIPSSKAVTLRDYVHGEALSAGDAPPKRFQLLRKQARG